MGRPLGRAIRAVCPRQNQADLLAEQRLLDRMVAASYRGMKSFPLFAAISMLYFAGGIGDVSRRKIR